MNFLNGAPMDFIFQVHFPECSGTPQNAQNFGPSLFLRNIFGVKLMSC